VTDTHTRHGGWFDDNPEALTAVLLGHADDQAVQAFLAECQLGRITPPQAATLLVTMADLIDPACQALSLPRTALDTCGTGGSGRAGRFNVSTTVAFVVASFGVPVLKFGNKAVTGNSGSFDLLDHLGCDGPLSVAQRLEVFQHTGLTFLYAPACYPAFAALQQARKAFGRPTVFNLLGPMLNPARPARRLMGVKDPQAMHLLTALCREPSVQGLLSPERFLLVASQDAHGWLDEFLLGGESHLAVVGNDVAGMMGWVAAAMRGDAPPLPPPVSIASPADSAHTFRAIISGADAESFWYWQVVWNSALSLLLADHVRDLPAALDAVRAALAQGQCQSFYEQVRHHYGTLRHAG
jgi:anthranilate phosphoribosyltransferase